MKIFVFAFALFTLAAHGAPGTAQVATIVTARDVKIDKISPAVVSPPQFQVTGAEQKRVPLLKWFEIEVDFDVKNVELVDELTFKYDVLINGKLCPGEITHINIPKGANHYSVMYISPRNLDRITAGKPLNPAMIENIWVTISRQGQILFVSSHKGKNIPIPNLPQMPGMLLPKSETPFQVLWWDRYEAVKVPVR